MPRRAQQGAQKLSDINTPYEQAAWTPAKMLFQHEDPKDDEEEYDEEEGGNGETEAAAKSASQPAINFNQYDAAGMVAMLGAFCLCASSEWSGLAQVIAPTIAQLKQGASHHEKEVKEAETIHQKEMKQAQRHQLRELKNEMKCHIEQVAVDLREASKEADRDNWEQRHSMFETLITSAAVMLGGSCSVIVEGLSALTDQSAKDVGHLIDDEQFQIYFCFLLGCSYGFLFMCILLAMVTLCTIHYSHYTLLIDVYVVTPTQVTLCTIHYSHYTLLIDVYVVTPTQVTLFTIHYSHYTLLIDVYVVTPTQVTLCTIHYTLLGE
jgi:hypothetical protein